MRTHVAIIGLFCATGFVSAQSINITDGFHALDPALNVTVIRQTSWLTNTLYCDPSRPPTPVECRLDWQPSTNLIDAVAIGTDAAGNTYHLAYSRDTPIDFGDGRGTLLQRTDTSGRTENIARIYKERCLNGDCSHSETFDYQVPSDLDATNGRIVMPVRVREFSSTVQIEYIVGILEVSGLPKLFDTLLTFVPSGQSISLLTPAYPDGFRSADSLQMWAGDVRTLPNWSQATALACPGATRPAPGQVVNVTDALPDPAAGQARYYLAASQAGAQRRLGRQYVGEMSSARDPDGLPVCQ